MFRLQTDAQDALALFTLGIQNLDGDWQTLIKTGEEAIARWNIAFGETPSGGGGTTGGGGEEPDEPPEPTQERFDPTALPRPFNRPPEDQDYDGYDDTTDIPISEWYDRGWPRIRYQMGGTVPGQPNEAHVAIVHGGERIISNQGGTLVLEENQRTVELLERIAVAIEEGDGKIVVQMQSPGGAQRLTEQVYDAAFAYGG